MSLHTVIFLSVAAQQAAKARKLERENKNVSDTETRTVSLDDAKSEHSSACALTSDQDVKPVFAYKLPQALEGLSNLPPSILPPPADAFAGDLPEWG